MNHTCLLAWNDAAQCQVPAPKNALENGKLSTGVKPFVAAIAIALKRVLGSDPSQILGQFNANGQVRGLK